MSDNNSFSGMRLCGIAEHLGAKLTGDGDRHITGMATLKKANAQQLSFLANPKYARDMLTTQAGAVIVSEAMSVKCPVATLVLADPYWGYARASRLFDRNPVKTQTGVHPSARVSDLAVIHPSASVGANAVIESGVHIGLRSVIGAGCVVGDRVRIGNDCLLYPHVTLYHDVEIGDNVIIQSGAVIGSDGFGFAPYQSRWEKIAQLGSVRIGHRVEIGANTTIDRGALDDTVIGNDVIIDNLVQIAHNVVIGDGTAIAGTSAVAGSTIIGRYCIIAGGVGIAGHLEIADHVHIRGMSMVSKSLKQAGSYSSGTGGAVETSVWQKNAVNFRRLSQMQNRLSVLETVLKKNGQSKTDQVSALDD